MVDIQHTQEDNLQVIEVKGEVDASSSIHLDNIMRVATDNGKDLIVDLSRLVYISSAGLGVFMSYLQELETNNQQMVLFGLNEKVKEVFQILGLDQLLTITGSMEESRKELNASV